eukprot:7389971-Prymnesium_polylepis.1
MDRANGPRRPGLREEHAGTRRTRRNTKHRSEEECTAFTQRTARQRRTREYTNRKNTTREEHEIKSTITRVEVIGWPGQLTALPAARATIAQQLLSMEMTGFRPAPYDAAESEGNTNADMHATPRYATAAVEREDLNWEWAGSMDRAALLSFAYW